MAYILQNAIQVSYKGKQTILNSRFANEFLSINLDGVEVYITGGKDRFEGTYESEWPDIAIENLCLTYSSSIEEVADKLLWFDFKSNSWVRVKDLPVNKLLKVIEEGHANVYIYKAIKFIYFSSIS